MLLTALVYVRVASHTFPTLCQAPARLQFFITAVDDDDCALWGLAALEYRVEKLMQKERHDADDADEVNELSSFSYLLPAERRGNFETFAKAFGKSLEMKADKSNAALDKHKAIYGLYTAHQTQTQISFMVFITPRSCMMLCAISRRS